MFGFYTSIIQGIILRSNADFNELYLSYFPIFVSILHRTWETAIGLYLGLTLGKDEKLRKESKEFRNMLNEKKGYDEANRFGDAKLLKTFTELVIAIKTKIQGEEKKIRLLIIPFIHEHTPTSRHIDIANSFRVQQIKRFNEWMKYITKHIKINIELNLTMVNNSPETIEGVESGFFSTVTLMYHRNSAGGMKLLRKARDAVVSKYDEYKVNKKDKRQQKDYSFDENGYFNSDKLRELEEFLTKLSELPEYQPKYCDLFQGLDVIKQLLSGDHFNREFIASGPKRVEFLKSVLCISHSNVMCNYLNNYGNWNEQKVTEKGHGGGIRKKSKRRRKTNKKTNKKTNQRKTNKRRKTKRVNKRKTKRVNKKYKGGMQQLSGELSKLNYKGNIEGKNLKIVENLWGIKIDPLNYQMKTLYPGFYKGFSIFDDLPQDMGEAPIESINEISKNISQIFPNGEDKSVSSDVCSHNIRKAVTRR
jgi:hypothetical protein